MSTNAGAARKVICRVEKSKPTDAPHPPSARRLGLEVICRVAPGPVFRGRDPNVFSSACAPRCSAASHRADRASSPAFARGRRWIRGISARVAGGSGHFAPHFGASLLRCHGPCSGQGPRRLSPTSRGSTPTGARTSHRAWCSCTPARESSSLCRYSRCFFDAHRPGLHAALSKSARDLSGERSRRESGVGRFPHRGCQTESSPTI